MKSFPNAAEAMTEAIAPYISGAYKSTNHCCAEKIIKRLEENGYTVAKTRKKRAKTNEKQA